MGYSETGPTKPGPGANADFGRSIAEHSAQASYRSFLSTFASRADLAVDDVVRPNPARTAVLEASLLVEFSRTVGNSREQSRYYHERSHGERHSGLVFPETPDEKGFSVGEGDCESLGVVHRPAVTGVRRDCPRLR